MKNILIIAPDISVKGGISTVIKGFLSSSLSQKYSTILVASHVDGTKLRKYLQAITGILKAAYYLLLKQIDIVHIHGGDVTSMKRKYLYFRLIKLFERKVIYHFHGASFMEQFILVSPGWKHRIKALLEESNMVICLSESWKYSIMQIAPKSNIRILYNSVSLPKYYEYLKEDKKTINIVFLGAIGERKGIFDLIEVVSQLILEGCNIHLTVGGNGDIDRFLKEIEIHNLKNHVTYAGWIVGEAKDSLFRDADIFVLPSYAEGMPMTILEAMSYAIPVISTNVGGIPEIIKDGETGYLAEPGNCAELYNKILSLIKDSKKRKRMGKAGQDLIEKRHNILVNVELLTNIYESL